MMTSPVSMLTCADCGRPAGFRVDGRCAPCARAARQATPRRTAAPSPSAAERELQRRRAAEAEMSLELRATSEGERLGRQYRHEPAILARAIGAQVTYVPMAEMQDPSQPGFERWGYTLLGSQAIVVAGDRPARDVAFTLAHECAHHLLGASANERHADIFAREFLRVRDDELPGHLARQYRDHDLRAARQQARRRAR